MKPKKTPTKSASDALIRALAGLPPETGLEAPTPGNGADEAPVSDKAGLEAPKEPEVPKTEAEPPKTELQAPAPTPAPTPAPDPLVAHLKSELAESRASSTALSVKVAELSAQLETLKGENTSMKAFETRAREGLEVMANRMSVALGATPVSTAGLPASSVLDIFASVKATFDSRFLIGGKAQTEAKDLNEGNSGEPSAAQLHSRRATKL